MHRTAGEALSIVKDYGSDDGELPMQSTIASLWKELDRLFLPSVKPSGDLLNELLTHPTVTFANRDRLKAFSQKCSRLLDFTIHDSEMSPAYDNTITLTEFGRRLDPALSKECIHETQKLEKSN